jgi:hypothetical protein
MKQQNGPSGPFYFWLRYSYFASPCVENSVHCALHHLVIRRNTRNEYVHRPNSADLVGFELIIQPGKPTQNAFVYTVRWASSHPATM